MTRSKCERLKQELIAKYGADKVLIRFYDAYFPIKEGYRCISNFIAQLTLADAVVEGWGGYKDIEALCKAKYPKELPLKTEESRLRYESPEEQEKRKKEEEEFMAYVDNYRKLFQLRPGMF